MAQKLQELDGLGQELTELNSTIRWLTMLRMVLEEHPAAESEHNWVSPEDAAADPTKPWPIPQCNGRNEDFTNFVWGETELNQLGSVRFLSPDARAGVVGYLTDYRATLPWSAEEVQAVHDRFEVRPGAGYQWEPDGLIVNVARASLLVPSRAAESSSPQVDGADLVERYWRWRTAELDEAGNHRAPAASTVKLMAIHGVIEAGLRGLEWDSDVEHLTGPPRPGLMDNHA